MNRDALDELFDYTTFTWATYANVLRDLPPDAITTPVPNSGWPALRNTLFHVAMAWDGWLRDRLNLTDTLDATPESITSWSDLQPHRERTRAWLRRLIDETPDDALYTRVDPTWEDWRPGLKVSIGDVLTHILLHERGHHGDITTLLSMLGNDAAPSTEYLTYNFFKNRQKS